jgi:hypothetical protein
MVGSQPPADLDSGHEGGIKIRHVQPYKSDKRLSLPKFRREKAEAMLFKMPFNAVQQLVAPFALQQARHELHYSWIRV